MVKFHGRDRPGLCNGVDRGWYKLVLKFRENDLYDGEKPSCGVSHCTGSGP